MKLESFMFQEKRPKMEKEKVEMDTTYMLYINSGLSILQLDFSLCV